MPKLNTLHCETCPSYRSINKNDGICLFHTKNLDRYPITRNKNEIHLCWGEENP